MVGAVFIIVYVFVITLIFINVLTAILAFTFESNVRQGEVIFYNKLIYFVRQGNYKENIRLYAINPIIMQFMIIPYSLIRLIIKDEKTEQYVTDFFVHIAYLPIFITTFIFLFLLNALLLPIVYIFNLMFLINYWLQDKIDF